VAGLKGWIAMLDPLDAFKDQAFYWEARRLREEQRQRLGISRQADRPANVVSFAEFREQRMQRSPTDKPTKPAA
jgi:hypothetical protein